MIQDFFINTVTIKKNLQTTYEDWLSKKWYQEETTINCRVSSLNYKDLQLLGWENDIQKNIKKIFTSADVDISPKDKVVFNNQEYVVIAEYNPQDRNWIHHKKFFIKFVW